ncbi:MAG: ATP-binding protein [Kineosporiaceae bacterium]
MVYSRRLIDDELDELLAGLSAVALEGPKGVGKTATATRRASRVFSLDDDAQRATVATEPATLDRVDGTVVIDEWQRHPPVWDHVRRQVDGGAPPGRYLLTGSAMPVDAPAHSGAGRIVPVRMRPLSLAERQLDTPAVSLGGLLTGSRPAVQGDTSVSLTGYVDEILGSGLPGIRPLAPRLRVRQLDGYLERLVLRDFADQGLAVRRPEAVRAWLTAYAAATATTTSYNAILRAATPGEDDKPAKTTTIAYREVLAQLWMLDAVPGWVPTRNRLARLMQAPKHHLADPALAARLLQADHEVLLRDGHLLGRLFEGLVTQSVQVYAGLAGARVSHLRQEAGRREVDLIVEGPGLRVLALEVKLTRSPGDGDVRNLLWLRDQLGDDLLDAVVVTAGPYAYRRPDGVAVVPAALLGP